MRRPFILMALGLISVSAESASALDLPTRRAGLWDIKMTFEGRNIPAQAMQQCIDAATDKLMNGSFASQRTEACSKQDVQRVGTTIVVDSVCKFGAMTTTSHAVISGNFDQAYTVKVSSTREGGPPAPKGAPDGQSNMTMEAKWVGPCKADQKPGDMVMPNGMKMNVRDVQNMIPPGAMPQRPGLPPQR
jgi:hypothetical protein